MNTVYFGFKFFVWGIFCQLRERKLVKNLVISEFEAWWLTVVSDFYAGQRRTFVVSFHFSIRAFFVICFFLCIFHLMFFVFLFSCSFSRLSCILRLFIFFFSSSIFDIVVNFQSYSYFSVIFVWFFFLFFYLVFRWFFVAFRFFLFIFQFRFRDFVLSPLFFTYHVLQHGKLYYQRQETSVSEPVRVCDIKFSTVKSCLGEADLRFSFQIISPKHRTYVLQASGVFRHLVTAVRWTPVFGSVLLYCHTPFPISPHINLLSTLSARHLVRLWSSSIGDSFLCLMNIYDY